MNKEQLRKKCYEMGNSQLPLDVFFNDIRDNKAPNFNKAEAYADLEKIVDYIAKLQDENKELRNSIKSWDETAGNLLKENRKLKKAIDILKEAVDEIEIITCDEKDCYGELCLYQKINGSISIPLKTKEEYILAKEVLENV